MKKTTIAVFALSLFFGFSMSTIGINDADAATKSKTAKKHIQKKKYKKSRRKKRSGGGCQTLSRSTLENKAKAYKKSISSASRKYGVNKNLIKAVITVESCFKSRARGALGEKGLMQLMPKTAQRFNVRNGYNVWQNVHGGTRYLSYLLKRYKGDTKRAVAAYNAGEGRIKRGGRIPNMKYVRKVMTAYHRLSNGKAQRIYTPDKAYTPTKTNTLKKKNKNATSTKSTSKNKKTRYWYKVKRGDTVYGVMRKTNTPVRSIVRMNNLKRPYKLLPGQKLQVNNKAKLSKHLSTAKNSKPTYQVKAGDTMYSIMRETGTPVKKLVRINKLQTPNHLKIGQVIRIR